ncbi:MAG TPA: TIGR03790 family protein [Verrucomicrobiae bacterium]|nr:TIGR03790 family protein [Verrucomicrobiae bacterium]
MGPSQPSDHIRAWAISACFLLGVPGAPALLTPDRLLVVYNESLPASQEVARYYCAGRGIPPERMLGIRCPAVEEISREEFERSVRDPIDAQFVGKGWIARESKEVRHERRSVRLEIPTHNEIYGIALCWGVPLRIADDTNRAEAGAAPQARTTAAAVDSELAVLPIRGTRLSGPLANPFYRCPQGFDGRFARNIMLVTRLDGPSPDTVKARLDDAWRAEREGLVGWACFDARGIKDGGYKQGDDWLLRAAQMTRRWGMPTTIDEGDAIVGPDALWSDIALYAGWYAGSISGALAEPSFRFRPGAVAYHIHSFSASTVRNANAAWVGPLVDRGAAATIGSVLEPYLSLTPNVDVFVENLLLGRTFAEAAYASEPVLSWMITFVGDPLYRPFPEFPEAWLQEHLRVTDGMHPWYFFASANRRKNPTNVGSIFSEVDAYLATRVDPLAHELGGQFFADTFDPGKAISSYTKGATLAPGSPAATRISLKAVRLLTEEKRFGEAWTILDGLGKTAADNPLVRATAEQLSKRADAQPVSPFWRSALQGPAQPMGTNAPASPVAANPPGGSAIPLFLQDPSTARSPSLPTNTTPRMTAPKMTFPTINRPQLRPPTLEPHIPNPRPPDK